MSPDLILERVNVIGDVSDRELAILVDVFLDSLLLQAAEKGLGYGIVPAVPLATHARLQAVRLAYSLPGITSVTQAMFGRLTVN